MKIIDISQLYRFEFYLTNINFCHITPKLEVKNYTYRSTPAGHFVYGTHGTARYFKENLNIDIRPGVLAYIPTGCSVKFEEDIEYEYYKIYFNILDTDTHEYISLAREPTLFFKNTPKEIVSMITEFTAFYSINDSTSSLRFRSMIFSLLHTIAKTLEDTNMRTGMTAISNAFMFMQSNYMLEFTTKDLADMCNLSESYFRTLFKKQMGVSPTEYKNQLRIRRACEILLGTSQQVEHIAESVGFNNVQYFCEIFKKITGVSALHFRNGEKPEPIPGEDGIIIELSQFGINSPVEKKRTQSMLEKHK